MENLNIEPILGNLTGSSQKAWEEKAFEITNSTKEVFSKEFATKEELNSVKKDVQKLTDACADMLGMISDHDAKKTLDPDSYAAQCEWYKKKTKEKLEKGNKHMKVKTFLKKSFIIVFTTIGIFSTINYITNNRLVHIVHKGIEEVTNKVSIIGINIIGNGKYHGRNWDSYSPEYKKKVFDALSFRDKQELIEFLKSGINEEIEAFRNNIK